MDPVTITVLAMKAIGGLIKGIGAYTAGRNQKRQFDAAADQASQEAGVRAAVQQEENAQTEGEAAVRAAANGGGLSGSAFDVLGDIQRKGAFNVRSTLWSGYTEAEADRYKGRIAQKEGALGAIGAGVETAGSLASTWGQSAEAAKQRTARSRLGTRSQRLD